MSDKPIREIVAHFAEEERFRAAVEALVEAGFERDALSVLGSHDSLEVAEAARSPLATWLAALTGEVKYVGPLAAAGFIALASGPIGFFISGLVAAGVAGLAAKEFLDELTAADHAEAFKRAFEAGDAILWVRVADDDDAGRAAAVLAEYGGARIHEHRRAATDHD